MYIIYRANIAFVEILTFKGDLNLESAHWRNRFFNSLVGELHRVHFELQVVEFNPGIMGSSPNLVTIIFLHMTFVLVGSRKWTQK
jgi:hypothetical protein